MDDCTDFIGDARVFTTSDAESGYWKVKVPKIDRDKTTFTCLAGLFRFLRMPFGLRNAPATFQRALDIFLSNVKWLTAIVYIDDLFIYSRTVKEFFVHVRLVLKPLQEAGATFKLKKCVFLDQQVEYLGHVVSPGRLPVAKRNIQGC